MLAVYLVSEICYIHIDFPYICIYSDNNYDDDINNNNNDNDENILSDIYMYIYIYIHIYMNYL
jgi:hypothetical protein